MKSQDGIAMSAFESGQLESILTTEGEYITSIKNFYEQLKSPYMVAQHSIRQRLEAEGNSLYNCQRDMSLHGTAKQKVSKLREQADAVRFEIGEMESGLQWATAKIRELDEQMESKLRLVSERYDLIQHFRSNPVDAVVHYSKDQREKLLC